MTATPFKAADAASYDDVSREFDSFSERYSAPLADRLVALAGVGPGERVLDVGTGTGVVALRAATGAGHEGIVLGIDLSDGMLRTARSKVQKAGVAGRLEFRHMDAEAMDLPDASQDVVLSLFALLHFPHPLAALGEMRRVLRSRGRLALGVGSPPPVLSLAALQRGLRRIPEALRRRRGLELTAPDSLEALVLRRLPATATPEVTDLARQGHQRPRSIPALVREAGFTCLRTCWEGREAVIETPEEFWELQHTSSTLARKRLASASPEQARGVREELLETARRVRERGGRLVYRYAALFVAAERPAIAGA